MHTRTYMFAVGEFNLSSQANTREIEAETEASRKTASGHLAQQENFLPIKLLTICGVTRRDRVPATSLIENPESENARKVNSVRGRSEWRETEVTGTESVGGTARAIDDEDVSSEIDGLASVR